MDQITREQFHDMTLAMQDQYEMENKITINTNVSSILEENDYIVENRKVEKIDGQFMANPSAVYCNNFTLVIDNDDSDSTILGIKQIEICMAGCNIDKIYGKTHLNIMCKLFGISFDPASNIIPLICAPLYKNTLIFTNLLAQLLICVEHNELGGYKKVVNKYNLHCDHYFLKASATIYKCPKEILTYQNQHESIILMNGRNRFEPYFHHQICSLFLYGVGLEKIKSVKFSIRGYDYCNTNVKTLQDVGSLNIDNVIPIICDMEPLFTLCGTTLNFSSTMSAYIDILYEFYLPKFIPSYS